MNWNPEDPADQILHPPQKVFTVGMKQHHIANTAYPIGHNVTMRPYRIRRSQAQEIISHAWQKIKRLGLYVHIPFCEQRCGYCEYCVVEPEEFHTSEDEYFELLQEEFKQYKRALDTQTKELVGFDIGGGTPSAVQTKHIANIIQTAKANFQIPKDITISIETTPRIAAQQPKKIHDYYQMGIHRISMGVQMVSPRLLKMVGRPHTSLDDDHAATENIRTAGFEKFNVDVMYGFAKQTLGNIEATLAHVLSLNPEYVTLYRMRYKGTRLAAQAESINWKAIYEQYKLAQEILHAAGYMASDGKNTFSRLPGDPGTSDYLTERVIHGTPYLGLGLGAQSLSEVTLAYNAGAAEKRLANYRRIIKAGNLPLQDVYHLSRRAAMGKMIAVSFYFGEIHLPSFKKKFGQTLEDAFPSEIAFIREQGLMTYIGEKETLRLTSKGVAAYSGVIALFYAPAVQSHLVDLSCMTSPTSSLPAPAMPAALSASAS